MNHGRARMLLCGVEQTAGELHAIVAREAPEFACFWRDVVAECRELVAAEWLAPHALEELAQAIVRALGVGMGSLSDLVLMREDRAEMKRANAHLDMLRNKLGAFGERLRLEAIEGTINTFVVRRHLTELETVLLDRARERDHQAQALAFVVDLEEHVGLGHATRTQAMPVLNKIRHELRPYVVDAERTA